MKPFKIRNAESFGAQPLLTEPEIEEIETKKVQTTANIKRRVSFNDHVLVSEFSVLSIQAPPSTSDDLELLKGTLSKQESDKTIIDKSIYPTPPYQEFDADEFAREVTILYNQIEKPETGDEKISKFTLPPKSKNRTWVSD